MQKYAKKNFWANCQVALMGRSNTEVDNSAATSHQERETTDA